MIPESPFLFSIAALSASLAGLAGLVAAFRRGTDLRPIDQLRLREIVEFAFANILLAVSIIPGAALAGSTIDAVRWAGVVAALYLVANMVVLALRTRRLDVPVTRGWAISAVAINLAALATCLAILLGPAIALYMVLMIFLLARPMLAFLLVLNAFESR